MNEIHHKDGHIIREIVKVTQIHSFSERPKFLDLIICITLEVGLNFGMYMEERSSHLSGLEIARCTQEEAGDSVQIVISRNPFLVKDPLLAH